MIHLYLSYADEDKAHGNRLKSQLQPVQSSLGFAMWSRQDVRAGAVFQHVMAEHLAQSRIFVPLISADFLYSKPCDAELRAALVLQQQGRINIISVLLRPTFLDESPLLPFQMLPATDKPVTAYADRDYAWLKVQRGLVDVVKRMQIAS